MALEEEAQVIAVEKTEVVVLQEEEHVFASQGDLISKISEKKLEEEDDG